MPPGIGPRDVAPKPPHHPPLRMLQKRRNDRYSDVLKLGIRMMSVILLMQVKPVDCGAIFQDTVSQRSLAVQNSFMFPVIRDVPMKSSLTAKGVEENQ